MPVELIWDGKYDAEGRKNAPLRVALPFQTVETVNESVQERQRGLEALFSAGRETKWRNRLIWGDKRFVLPSLLQEFAGKVNLIYIDPPFATGDDFSFQVEIEGEEFTKEPSMMEQKAYRDTWGRGLDSYLQWFYETAIHLRDLLSENGSIYVHLDWHVSHYVKSVMDEVFGIDNFKNEIVWKRSDAKGDATQGSKHYSRIQDSILYYSKTGKATWNALYVPLSQEYADNFYKYQDSDGRRWKMENMLGPGGAANGNPVYEVMGVVRPWRYSKEKMQALIDSGLVVQTKPGNVPMQKKYLDESKGVQVGTWWDDISMIRGWSAEKTGYSTQKPEALLERIIKASSNEGDLVLDCFCGSGTTAAVAEKLNRRWITCDLGRFAIHTARKRILSIPNVRPFIVQNLGKYERQAWQQDEFGADASGLVEAYTRFILELYRAQPLNGFAWLHGLKAGRVTHVGAVDSPVTLADVRSLLIEWRKNLGKTGARETGIDILGWEFALDMNETAKQQAAEAGVDLRFLTIPREVLEKKAVEQGDIQFFELAALDVKETIKKRELSLTLANFIAPLEYVPQEIRQKITRWDAWIDYWAVDFDFKGDTFHNQWQSYRTRKNKKLELTAKHIYEETGTYTVQVKVIDILGNDTTRTLKVEVK